MQRVGMAAGCWASGFQWRILGGAAEPAFKNSKLATLRTDNAGVTNLGQKRCLPVINRDGFGGAGSTIGPDRFFCQDTHVAERIESEPVGQFQRAYDPEEAVGDVGAVDEWEDQDFDLECLAAGAIGLCHEETDAAVHRNGIQAVAQYQAVGRTPTGEEVAATKFCAEALAEPGSCETIGEGGLILSFENERIGECFAQAGGFNFETARGHPATAQSIPIGVQGLGCLMSHFWPLIVSRPDAAGTFGTTPGPTRTC
jgi:hypothetical protein